MNKRQEKKLDVTEMKVLRWMCSVTKTDRLSNEIKRETTKVLVIYKKAQEDCNGSDEEKRRDVKVGRRVVATEVQGRTPRGRPERRWMECVRGGLDRETTVSGGGA